MRSENREREIDRIDRFTGLEVFAHGFLEMFFARVLQDGELRFDCHDFAPRIRIIAASAILPVDRQRCRS